MSVSDKVKGKLRDLPDRPGVYLMRDRNGRVIYVGKAASLRKRVQTYFRNATLRSADPKLRGLIKSVDDVDVLVVRTEEEATLTEGRLIKEYRPRYNVAFRDDKRFLLLRVDLNEPWPRFSLCRIQKDDGAVYFGPYASAASARVAQEFIEKRYGVRQCRPRVPGPDDYRHCINDVVRFCSAPCIQKIGAAEYRHRVEEACAFLRGERKDVLKDIEAEMQAASDAREFERAAAVRDTLFKLRMAIKRRMLGRKDLEVATADAVSGVEELKYALRLRESPTVIECYDISNISGTHAVGSLVCAVNGLPHRNRYRLYRIKTVDGIDDPGMMAEVIRRRFNRALRERSALPKLVLVDGGITQLRAARAELDRLGLADLPAAGLAKRFEEIYVEADGVSSPLRLAPDSPALKVLKQIRDEAHRFALTYHRKLRARKIRESALDAVPGIGNKRKEQLLQHFGSIRRLRKAGLQDIAAVPGIGPETAALIRSALHGESPVEEADGS